MLSAAAQRHQNQRAARAGGDEKEKTPVAYTPIPDSNGLVDNYDELYPSNHWKDPNTCLRWSSTVEESITNGLDNDFAYYVDERDKDKNNEQARGEGTSAQGAISSRSGHSRRSSKEWSSLPLRITRTPSPIPSLRSCSSILLHHLGSPRLLIFYASRGSSTPIGVNDASKL